MSNADAYWCLAMSRLRHLPLVSSEWWGPASLLEMSAWIRGLRVSPALVAIDLEFRIFMLSALKACCEAEGEASRWADGVAGEQTTEVDDVQDVGEILSVDLKEHMQTVRLVNIRARRRIDLQGRVDTSAVKINPIQHLLAVFSQHRGRIAIELEWESGVVLNSPRDPEARCDLVTKASAHGVALIL